MKLSNPAPVFLSIGFLMVSAEGCKSRQYNNSGSEVRNIPFGPKPTRFEPTITCGAKHTSKERNLGGVNRVYKTSAEADYLSPDWQKRIASDFAFFNASNTGESDRDANSDSDTHSVVLIDIRTVNGVPHYYYYGNKNWNTPTETWSSSKMVGAGLFLHKLRTLSNGQVGGDATFPGGSIRDDMDHVNDESSNEHGSWYKAMMGPASANAMIHNWLYRTGDTFGHFHAFNGAGSSLWDVPVAFTAPNGTKSPTISPNWNSAGGNTLSMLTQAEYMKRIGVNFRDEVQLPKMGSYDSRRSSAELASAKTSWTKEDIVTLMFGDYPTGGMGGMMYDGLRDVPRGFTKNGHIPDVPDFSGVEKISGGRWVSVGKGGSGQSDSRFKKEEVMMDYFRIPSANGGEGIEFAIAARMSVPSGGDPLTRIWKTYSNVLATAYPDLFSGGPVVNWIIESGTATATANTILKKSPQSSGNLTPDQMCSFPAGNVLGYEKRLQEGDHIRLKLKFEDRACAGFGTDVYIFSGHFKLKSP